MFPFNQPNSSSDLSCKISMAKIDQQDLNPSAMEMEFPPYFRCPISMEVMQDPVTISTGVSFERTNIEKWFFIYKKKTCPATMQKIVNFDITPNFTLKRLILSWHIMNQSSSQQPLPPRVSISALLKNIESSPFKASSLKKLRLIMMVDDDEMKSNFVQANGFEILIEIVIRIDLSESSDFVNFEACEEALGLLSQFPISITEKPFDMLWKAESMRSVEVILQKGSAEGRFYAITILQKMAKNGCNWNFFIKDQGIDFFKSLLELVSDEICGKGKASSCALEVLIEIMESSKKSRLRSIDAGAVWVLIDQLPDANRSKCEKILHLLKLMSECAEGRLAMTEHTMGIVAVTEKMMNVSNLATKIGAKILWLICNYHPNERVLEEMMICGSVKKLLKLGLLLHIHGGSGSSSTKEKVMKIMKLHGNFWRRLPCFTHELKDYLTVMNLNR